MTPIASHLSRNWPRFSLQLDSARVRQCDIELYVMWTIDQLRERAELFAGNFWSQLREAIRGHTLDLGLTPTRGDIDYLTDVTLALTLSGIGLLLIGSDTQILLYQRVIGGLGEHRGDVLCRKRAVEYDDTAEPLRQWLNAYWHAGTRLTEPDAMAWRTPEPYTTRQQLDGRNITHVHNPQGCTIIENQIIHGNK